MKKKSFNRGMHKLQKRGVSKQKAFNQMKGLARKNNSKNKYVEVEVPSWIRYLGALILELVLIFYKIPSNEGLQISLIQTIIPLSEATRPMAGFVTIIAILFQVISLLLIYDLVVKLFNSIKKKFS
jgi:hypothetical protein